MRFFWWFYNDKVRKAWLSISYCCIGKRWFLCIHRTWNIWALLLWFLNVPTLYFSKMFTMILNLVIVIKQFKHIYGHCHMPRTMWMLMKHLGARPARSHPRTKERGNTLARRRSWTPMRQAVPHHESPRFSNFVLLSVCFCYLCQWSVMLPESPEWLLWTEYSAKCQIWGRKTALDPWLC